MRITFLCLCAYTFLNSAIVQAQDTVSYVGATLSNVDYHHGQLSPVVGVHNIQIFRANREHPEWGDNHSFTYNHQSFIAYWNHQFYVQYLSNPIGEHIAEGKTLLQRSADGYRWSGPEELFPPYLVPEGFSKPNREDKAGKELYAIMHQRMGFYVSKNDKLLTIGYYGVAMDAKDDPNDGNGIGRVVREIKKDGSFGPIYFIRFNASFPREQAKFPFYTASKDKEFVLACEELLQQPLYMQQWVEEADRDDPLVPFKRPLKAFANYHLEDGRVVGLWKHALTSISEDGGLTWKYNPLRAPGFVNSNAKIWGQRLSDGNFATVYNPSEFRWPLAISSSRDGVQYDDLMLINGEISTMRYGGNYKSYGPQYVRGIQEGNGIPPDHNMWLTYSMNKEDIWVATVPVPLERSQEGHVHDDFSGNGEESFRRWNIFSPLWAPVQLKDGALELRDKDPYDYAKAERLIPAGRKGSLRFIMEALQNTRGKLEIELTNNQGLAASRIVFDEDGLIKVKTGYREIGLIAYEPNKEYHFQIDYDVSTRSLVIRVNNEGAKTRLFFQPVSEISRVVYRTGKVRRFPDADTPTDQNFDVPNPGEPVDESTYRIKKFSAQCSD